MVFVGQYINRVRCNEKVRTMPKTLNSTTMIVSTDLRDKIKEYRDEHGLQNMHAAVADLYEKEVSE
jgi:peroxiredoxin